MHGSSLTRSGLSEIILCGVGTQELDPLFIPWTVSIRLICWRDRKCHWTVCGESCSKVSLLEYVSVKRCYSSHFVMLLELLHKGTQVTKSLEYVTNCLWFAYCVNVPDKMYRTSSSSN